jgi:hypothetical protein
MRWSWRAFKLQSDGAPAPILLSTSFARSASPRPPAQPHGACGSRTRTATPQGACLSGVCRPARALPACLASQFPVRIATATSFIGNGPGRTYAATKRSPRPPTFTFLHFHLMKAPNQTYSLRARISVAFAFGFRVASLTRFVGNTCNICISK